MAGKWVQLESSVKVLPAGIILGFTVIAMIFVNDWRIAAALLFFIGMLSGFFVVPLNALLQHRGHLLMGAGHSIAIQNFNENLGILLSARRLHPDGRTRHAHPLDHRAIRRCSSAW
jgi:MFS transporter, LPLT family, lysophospholipid transporter